MRGVPAVRHTTTAITMRHYALSEEFRSEFKFKCIDSLIPQPRTGDGIVPVFTGDEDKQEAMSWLDLFTQWALQQGLSADHTLLLASTHVKYSLIYYPQLSTWTEFIQDFFAYYHAVGDSLFIEWYWKRAESIQISWFSYRELKTATNNFSEHKIVGSGKAALVYKGVLADDRVVAVKKYTESIGHSLEEILYEVFLLRNLPRSSNLVRLVGFSSYEQDPLLVYEYVSGGNLEQHLEGIVGEKLSWNERLNVAIDVADAVSQLHYNRKFPVYHRNIKSSNVLLDEHRRAKLADFGIAAGASHKKHKVCHTKVKGSRGYMDPHYESTGKLTDTTDVYSFGVVLMELVTSLRAGDSTHPNGFLPDLVMETYSQDRVEELVDEFIFIPCPCKHCLRILVEEVVELAIMCCSPDPTKRPKISEVCEKLRLIQLEQKMRSMEAGLREEQKTMELTVRHEKSSKRGHQ